mmetsp:Transcript_23992/g.42970  ORF Transcript_23992/g.42970 Transcript_23992/m.42970 type:complete len:213 (-) Transcript_23992:220-858(-)
MNLVDFVSQHFIKTQCHVISTSIVIGVATAWTDRLVSHLQIFIQYNVTWMRKRRRKEMIPQVITLIANRQRHRARLHPVIQPHAQCIALVGPRPHATAPTTFQTGDKVHESIRIIMNTLRNTSIHSRLASPSLTPRIVISDHGNMPLLFECIKREFIIRNSSKAGIERVANVVEARGGRDIDRGSRTEVGGVGFVAEGGTAGIAAHVGLGGG